MKVIFLDVDGVLNCTKTERGWGKMRFVDTRKMLRVRPSDRRRMPRPHWG